MKTKLEAIANVMIIAVALTVGLVMIGRYTDASRIARPVATGEHLATIPNLDWTQHQHTLVLALNTGCHYCEQSVPLYQKLAQLHQSGGEDLGIVAVLPNGSEMVRDFMTKNNLHIQSVAAVPLENLQVNATPTLILVDKDGRVERSWVGMLNPNEEGELLKLLAAASSPDCSTAQLPTLPAGSEKGCGPGIQGQLKN